MSKDMRPSEVAAALRQWASSTLNQDHARLQEHAADLIDALWPESLRYRFLRDRVVGYGEAAEAADHSTDGPTE